MDQIKNKFIFSLVLLFSFVIASNLQAQEESYIPTCSLKVALHPQEGAIQGSLKIRFPQEKKFFLKKENLQIESANPKAFKIKPEKKIYAVKENSEVEIIFAGKLNSPTNYIDAQKGVYLNGLWFPQMQDVMGETSECLYSLEVEVPSSYHVISENDESQIKKTETANYFYFLNRRSLLPIHLYASNRYEFASEEIQIDDSRLTVQTWFWSQHSFLSSEYIKKIKEYALRYYTIFGFFPYQNFVMVEADGEDVISIPGVTVIGKDVIFLPANFLAHKFVHQWLGVSIRVDISLGNWADGLTSYLTDYWEQERMGLAQAIAYRRNILTDYLLYRGTQDRQTVLEYKEATDAASESLGIGKVNLIFHLARMRMGDEKFFLAIRDFAQDYKYSRASWHNLIDSFNEQETNIANGVFWGWLNSRGLADFKMSAKSLAYKKGEYTFVLAADFSNHSIEQKRNLNFDGALYHEGGVTPLEFYAKNEMPQEDFLVRLNKLPDKIILDAEYKIPRSISDKEKSFRLINIFKQASLSKEKNFKVALAQDDEEFFSLLLEQLHISNKEIVRPTLAEAQAKNNILYLFRYKNKDEKFFQSLTFSSARYAGERRTEAEIKISPLDGSFFVSFIAAGDDVEQETILSHLARHQENKYVILQEDKLVEKILPTVRQGLELQIGEMQILDKEGALGFQEMLQKISGQKIICVGEQHNQPAHHLTQLKIIQHLVQNRKRVVIGMEMFPQSSQKALDDYVAKKINEEEFLLRSQYYKVWGFSYEFYKPILDYAREHKIPVRALNIEREIISKIAQGGIASLSVSERQKLPARIDVTNMEYKNNLKDFFYSTHSSLQMKKNDNDNVNIDERFENFFEAQVAWDESMAEHSAREFKKFAPNNLVVLAGNGHLQYGYGIPQRIEKRLSVAPVVLLQDFERKQDDAQPANYLLSSSAMPIKISDDFRLGLRFDTNAQNKLYVQEVESSSLAKTVGIKKDDVLEKINGKTVSDVFVLKTYLYLQDRNVPLQITITRSGIPMVFSFMLSDVPEGE